MSLIDEQNVTVVHNVRKSTTDNDYKYIDYIMAQTVFPTIMDVLHTIPYTNKHLSTKYK